MDFVDRLPVFAGNVRRALQRHFLVDFQTQVSLERSFPVLNDRILLLWIELEMAKQHPLEVCRGIDFAIDRKLRPLCSVVCQSIFKTKKSLERFCPALNEHVLLLWIEQDMAKHRPREICRCINFAMDRRLSVICQSIFKPRCHWKIFSCSKRVCFAFVNWTRNGWTAFARSLPTHKFRDWSKTEAALTFNLFTGYPKYQRHALKLHWRHWLGESMKRSAEVENVFFLVKARKIPSFACVY